MFNRSTLALSLALVALSHAAPTPVGKRINQIISDATADWQSACLAAGGSERCNPVSVTAFSTLLAGAGPCDQQNAADAMVDLAHTLNSDPEMVRLTQLFVQQPRNSPTSLSVPYCNTAPKNAELIGLFQCQFASTNSTLFVGNLAVGAPGTIPFGLSSPVNPPGSCPASKTTIPDGDVLEKLVANPGVSGSGAAPAAPTITTQAAVPPATTTAAPVMSSTAASAASVASSPVADAKPFTLQNGEDAQALNAKFATLTTSSACNAGDDACVNGGFAQCVGGLFQTTACAGGTSCFGLPLVNKAGTTIACTTESDAEARIAATGAQGGVTGNGSVAAATSDTSTTTPAETTPAATVTTSPAANVESAPAVAPMVAPACSKPFTLQNGQDAQILNAQFASLTAASSCTAGENACVEGGFAQCVNGKFVSLGCAASLSCFALPLVNSAGTSIACTTQSDALSRIANTGAVGGIDG